VLVPWRAAPGLCAEPEHQGHRCSEQGEENRRATRHDVGLTSWSAESGEDSRSTPIDGTTRRSATILDMAQQRVLVLASTSRYRAALLARLGVPFQQAPSHVDERAHDGLWESVGPVEYTLALARAKARAVAERHTGAWILGADQVGVLQVQGRAVRLDQPGTPERNVEQLMQLSGRTHELVGGIVLLDAASGAEQTHVDRQLLTMRAFTRAEAIAYVARCAPVDCAGGYRVEDAGIALFERIAGDDPTGIEGLPLMAVSRLLRGVGFDT
jgi:septum formation protein